MANVIEIPGSPKMLEQFGALQERLQAPAPALRSIGEDIIERMKQRFSTSTAPDGAPWAANSETTLIKFLQGKSRGGAKGKKREAVTATTKRPLIGESRALKTQLNYDVTESVLSLGSPLRYAAMQHFGGKKAQFPHLWGDIPARPIFPNQANGQLYPQEEAHIVGQLRAFLEG